MKFALAIVLGTLLSAVVAAERPPLPADYCHWELRDFAIEQPLCGLNGNAQRGRKLAADSHGGNCLACHQMPMPEEPLHGTLGPSLHGLASRMDEGMIRAHLVDQRQFNPMSIMPGFYRDPRESNRVADAFWGKTFLSAQQVEDVVAYLLTLK